MLNMFHKMKISFKKINKKYRIILIFVFLIWTFWFFGFSTLINFFLYKHRGLEKFPEINSNDNILIIVPHIDDEIISSAGLMQQATKIYAKIKIIYITNGDNNIYSIIKKDKKFNSNPNEFIKLGEQRMIEGKNAIEKVGLNKDNIIFLGYPDKGLLSMFSNLNSGKPYVAQGTKLSYNPYKNTFRQEQEYTGNNVLSDLTQIILDFKPTLIITSHLKDKHTDHKATFLFVEKVIKDTNYKLKVFSFITHYPKFPQSKKLVMNEFLFPPNKLFIQNYWFSLSLSQEEEQKKLEAINQYSSQLSLLSFDDLLKSFVKQNEIFELIEF